MPKFAHDPQIGAGYGLIKTKFDRPSQAGKMFPYNGDTSDESELNSSNEIEILRNQIAQLLNYSNYAKQPGNGRTDRNTFTKARLSLESHEIDNSDKRTLTGMVPYPMKRFDGPPIGSQATGKIYTIAPGRLTGSPYGWTRGVMSRDDEGPVMPHNFMSAIDPDLLQRTKMKLKLKRLS